MLEYRLYYLGDDGHIQGVAEFVSEDDTHAAEDALRRADGRRMELWRREHLIRVFERSPASV